MLLYTTPRATRVHHVHNFRHVSTVLRNLNNSVFSTKSPDIFRPLIPMMLLRAALRLPSSRSLLRAMSGAKSYSTSELLINDPKYSWLRKLGLQEENPGVCDGTWHANGPVRVYLHILQRNLLF